MYDRVYIVFTMRKTLAMNPSLSLKGMLPNASNLVKNATQKLSGQQAAQSVPMNGQQPFAYVALVPPPGMGPGQGQGFGMTSAPGSQGSQGIATGPVINNQIMQQSANANAAAAAASSAPMGGMMMNPAMVGGMAEAFLVLYKIITIVVALMFMLIVVFTTTDIFKYMSNEASQRWKRFYDPNMYNKDTTDVDALRYISAAAAEDETYNIFKTQRFISYIFMIVGIAIVILGLQIGLFFGMKLWAIFNGRVFNERVQLPMKLLAILLIIVVGGFAIKDVYTQRFTKRVQASLVDVRTQLSAIRTYIYSNLTKNPVFLRALVADDIDMMVLVLNDVLLSKKGASCTDSTKPCDTEVENMIFSMNLYSFLKYQIPSSDPEFENVLKLFTPEGVENRTVDPTMYFYYKQPVFIPNLYATIRMKLGKTPFYPSGGSAEAKQTAASRREAIMMLNINNKMQDLNTKLSRLHNLASGKVKVGTYLIVVALVVLVFCAILFFLFLPEIMPYLPIAIHYAQSMWKSIFRSKDVAKTVAVAAAEAK